MESAKSFLIEWTINFVKNKDVISRKIENIEKNKNGFDLYVKFKDKEQFFIISPSINDLDSIIPRLKNDSHFCIVALNSGENLQSLVKNWRKLVDFRFLSIIFVNPFSQLDKKWMIYPYTHNKICDESSLKTGLKSMFEMVEPIEEKELTAKIS